MESLYVLQLANGKYYVGKSADVNKRFEQHKSGSGSAWTREHKPIRILETRPLTSAHDETNVTKDLMKKYGIDNVRGGAYTAVDMPEEQANMIYHELRSASDACYKCGKPGHFANKCTRKSSFTANCSCGRTFLDFDEFMSHNRGCIARAAKARPEEEWVCTRCNRTYPSEDAAFACQCKFARIAREAARAKLNQRSSGSTSGVCYRCGRPGHYSPDCYARSHARGYRLDSDDDSD